MLLHDFLELGRNNTPDKTALVSDGQRISYSTLDQKANRIAHGLHDLGIRRGDRVLIFTRNRVEAVISLYGTLKAGAVFIMVPDTARAPYLHHLVSVTEPGAILIAPDLIPVLEETGTPFDSSPG